MPNAQLAADCASALGVSSDWLLGLSPRPEPVADLLATSLTITEAPRALIDETIFAWHREAAGYKIRHVPATLPDMLKTRAMAEWEYAPQLGRTADQAIGAFEDRLAWMRGARSDYEIALPLHELDAFASATGYYRGLPPTCGPSRSTALLTCATSFTRRFGCACSTRGGCSRPRLRSLGRCLPWSIWAAATLPFAMPPGCSR